MADCQAGLYLPLWQLDGTGLAERSAYGNPGTATGSALHPGRGRFFDGIDDYVSLGNPGQLDFERTEPFSIMVWLKPKNPASGDVVISKQKGESAPAYQGWSISLSPGFQIRLELINNVVNNWLQVRGETTINNGAWHLAAVTYAGNSQPSGVRMYLDAAPEKVTTLVSSLSASIRNSSAVNIGTYNNGGGGFWDGWIGEVVIVKRVMTLPEIGRYYLATGKRYR